MKYTDFSIIILNNNTDNLINCLNYINQQNFDLSKIEVIIETTELEEDIVNQIEKMEINCIIRIQEDLSTSMCYNDAISISNGRIINFTNSNIMFKNKNILRDIKKCSVDNEIMVCNLFYFDIDINKKIKYKLSSNVTCIIDLEISPGQICNCLESIFINKKLVDNIKYNSIYNEECKNKFILDLFHMNPSYYNMGNIELISLVPYEDNTSKNTIQYDFEWYNKSLDNWIKYLKEFDYIPTYIQETIYYILYSKYNCNLNDRNKNVLDEINYKDFVNKTKLLLEYIDDNIILQHKVDNYFYKIKHRFKVPRSLKLHFYKLKNNKVDKKLITHNTVYEIADNNRVPILDFTKEKINVYAINYVNGKLVFDCTLGIKDYLDDKDINLTVVYGNKKISIKRNRIYSTLKVFNKSFNNKYTFKFEVDITNNFNTLKAYLNFKDKKYLLSFNFVKVQARLNNSKRSYWNCNNFTVENKIDRIVVSKRSSTKTFKLETLFILSKLKNEKDKIRVCKLSFLRILYYLTSPFLNNKHIWITFDKLYKAGDNGEYVYQEGLKEKKNIYYIIKKDSPDYKRLKKQNKKHILVFNSLREKVYCLHAEVILKTHANILGFCGFDGLARTFVRGLFNSEIMEIQHGLTIQDIPEYQNRLVDNVKLYFVASKFEIENIMKPEYDYEKESIKLTGLARCDGLKNNDKKIILITPTWRHNIAAPSLQHGVPRGHNDIFKQSEYFKIYNSLINNKKLIKSAKENNYRIVYLIHPTLSGQIDDFDKNEFVDIIPAAGDISYEKILTESSLMVTDYSGVQYDFAYMRKPIIYFHPKELPPHYTNAAMDYNKDGFGPILYNTENLVKELCKSMEKNCKNDEKYIKRADNFFKFNDYKNCERIIKDVDKYLKNK